MNLAKRNFNISRYSITLEEQKKINKFVEEGSSGFWNLEKRINCDNLIHKYKTDGRNLKDVRNDQNLINLFKNLKDGNTNPKKY